MKLSSLLEGVVCSPEKFENIEIDKIAISSNDCAKGSLFVCLKGSNLDGHNFASDAVKKGASAIVCEKKLNVSVPQIIVTNTRKALAKIAANFFDNPAKQLKIIAITGTNGKTSTCYIIRSILEKNKKKCGLIGTNGVFIGRKKIAENLTTPDPIFLHEYLKRMYDVGCEFVIMEASAHAIYWNKLYGIKFECLALTNLSQDHLDFFCDMQNYGNVKKSFFVSSNAKSFAVNVDDNLGKEIANLNLKNLKTYSLKNASDFKVSNFNYDSNKTSFQIEGCNENFSSNLMGQFNVYNLACAVAVCKNIGLSDKEISSGLKRKILVPGRFNVFENKTNGSKAIIDFAHTPDGLEKALKTAKQICSGKIICVFGCGGNRDKTKRSKMGAIAEKLADNIIITSDNPRFESEQDIASKIISGIKNKTKVILQLDRKQAIGLAIKMSKKGDVVLIAGKGAENYQEKNGIKTKFSDAKCVREFLKSE